jgi:hypothetical protein
MASAGNRAGPERLGKHPVYPAYERRRGPINIEPEVQGKVSTRGRPADARGASLYHFTSTASGTFPGRIDSDGASSMRMTGSVVTG